MSAGLVSTAGVLATYSTSLTEHAPCGWVAALTALVAISAAGRCRDGGPAKARAGPSRAAAPNG